MLRHDFRGMTLTEVLVYCLLLGIFTTMLFTNLPQRGNQTTEDLRVATNLATKALSRVTLELSNASATSITPATSPPGAVFLSAQRNLATNFAYTSSGALAWQGWVAYLLQNGQLVRAWNPLPAGTPRSAVGPTPTPLAMVSAGRPEVVCRGVRAFTVSSPEAGLWQAEITVSVGGNTVTVSSAAGARN